MIYSPCASKNYLPMLFVSAAPLRRGYNSHDSKPPETVRCEAEHVGVEPKDMKSRPGEVRAARDLLIRLGVEHDGRYPWHLTSDPYRIFVAEYFLRRTTRSVVARIFPDFVSRFPSFSSLAVADPEEVLEMAREAGLFARTRRIVDVAAQIVAQAGLIPDRQALMALPSVGPYIADALLLYAYEHPAFPLDGNVQRVLLRLSGRPTSLRPSPYQDKQLEGKVERITKGLDASSLRALHQGILRVAWVTCRPRPACPKCPLLPTCRYGRELDRHTMEGNAEKAPPPTQ